MHLVIFASLFLVTFSASSSARTAASPPYFSRVWININHYLFFQELALQLYQPRQISPTSKTSVDDKHLSPNLSSLERGEDTYYARPAFFTPKITTSKGAMSNFILSLGLGWGVVLKGPFFSCRSDPILKEVNEYHKNAPWLCLPLCPIWSHGRLLRLTDMASGGPGGPGKFVHFDVAAELIRMVYLQWWGHGVCNKNTTL